MSNSNFIMGQAASAVNADPTGAWDLSFAYNENINAWNVTSPTYVTVKNVSSDMTGTPEGLFFKPDGTKMYIVSRGNARIYEYNLATAWVVNTSSFVQSFVTIDPCGVHFKEDGLQMYTVTSNGDVVRQYSLSTAWDISTASFVQSFSVASQDTFPEDLFFKPDGTKMYIVGSTGDDVNEYDLGTAWDISTASYLQNFSVAAQEITPKGLFFKEDGTQMYVLGPTGDDVNQYALSVPWDISTASYSRIGLVRTNSLDGVYGLFIHPDGHTIYTTFENSGVNNVGQWAIGGIIANDTLTNGIFFKPNGGVFYQVGETNDRVTQRSINGGFSVSAQEISANGVFFKPDGTKMYITGNAGNDINEYNLSTAWDISTALYLQNFDVSAQDVGPNDVFFKPDGTKMYMLGANLDAVYEYDLSTAWDISTASYLQNFSITGQETSPSGVFFKPDGTKMYITGSGGDDVNEYDLSTAWDVSSASYLQNFSVATEETAPQGIFFKPDGTKMYIIGSGGDEVNEYDLGTAWDISSASYLQNFSVSTEDTTPQGLFFKPDGTKMYVIGSTVDAVFEYDLSTAWDISTSSLDPKNNAWDLKFLLNNKVFSVATEEAQAKDLFFKPDGTKMYIIGNSGDDVNEYNLSTPWDIETASYLQNFSVSGQDTNPSSLFFKPDGTKMYIVGTSGDDVNEYDLSTAWDISSASFLQLFSVATEDTNPRDLFFRDDGLKMYVSGGVGRDINEYDLSTPWDVSTASYLQNFSLSPYIIAEGLFFKDDGTKMYICNSNRIYQYTLGPQL